MKTVPDGLGARLRSVPLSPALAAAFAAALALAASPAAAGAEELATQVRGGETIAGAVDVAGDTDEYQVVLFPGDKLTVKAKDDSPTRGLYSTLSLTEPGGAAGAAPAKITRNGTSSPTLAYTATTGGLHVLSLAGRTGGNLGAVGNYRVTIGVKRARTAPVTYADAAGGTISFRFGASDQARVSISAATRKGTFDLTGLVRPDAAPEPAFGAALKAAKNHRSAKLNRFALTGGAGLYELTGSFQAGAAVKVVASVDHQEKPRSRRLGDEPRFDPLLLPFPDEGIAGTTLFVTGTGFTYVDVAGGDDLYPRFFFGTIEVPRASINRKNGGFQFPAPAGVVSGPAYDILVVNADGQRAVARAAFSVPPLPVVTTVSASEAGPAGGRSIRITGRDFRSDTLLLFGTKVQQPAIVLPNRIDVVAPPHAPDVVALSLRDEFGRTVVAPGAFTYLDVPSNQVTSIDRTFLQSLGGETIAVTGADFGAGSVLTIDGADTGATLVSPTRMTFTSPQRAAGQAVLRVTDPYEQTSSIALTFKGFVDGTDTVVPAPVTTVTQADGWRATGVLPGDVTGDGVPDIVLLQSSPAVGGSSARSRIRVLKSSTLGVFSDITSTAIPAVSGDEDWRARDGVLADLDRDGDLDLAIVSDAAISSGARSSLRILRNDGTGVFTDRTSAWAPAVTTYGDLNQANAIVAVDVDGSNGADLVIAGSDYFTETTSVLIDPGSPGNPPLIPPVPPTYQTTTTYHAAVRVLLNDGTGKVVRTDAAMPSVQPGDVSQYQADTLVAGDVDGNGSPDLVLTSDRVTESPAGTYHQTARLLLNTSGVFQDRTATGLPSPSDPEYMQADRLRLADADADGDLDLFVLSNTVIRGPGSGTESSGPALRLFLNSGGTFTGAASDAFPAADGDDRLQAADVVVGDLNGDGKAEIVVVSAISPNSGTRACRILRATGSGAGTKWVTASLAIPSPVSGDDARGTALALIDLGTGDGDLDLVIVRNESDETVRSTRVLVNPAK